MSSETVLTNNTNVKNRMSKGASYPIPRRDEKLSSSTSSSSSFSVITPPVEPKENTKLIIPDDRCHYEKYSENEDVEDEEMIVISSSSSSRDRVNSIPTGNSTRNCPLTVQSLPPSACHHHTLVPPEEEEEQEDEPRRQRQRVPQGNTRKPKNYDRVKKDPYETFPIETDRDVEEQDESTISYNNVHTSSSPVCLQKKILPPSSAHALQRTPAGANTSSILQSPLLLPQHSTRQLGNKEAELRRTPGAPPNMIHPFRSSSNTTSKEHTGQGPLTYGLTLSTPVGVQRGVRSTDSSVNLSSPTPMKKTVLERIVEASSDVQTSSPSTKISLQSTVSQQGQHSYGSDTVAMKTNSTSLMNTRQQYVHSVSPENSDLKDSSYTSNALSTTTATTTTTNCNSLSKRNDNKSTTPYHMRPPLPPSNPHDTTPMNSQDYRERYHMYTPAGLCLAKNKELNLQTALALSGKFSPHTVRLTETLDDLLKDDENDEDSDHLDHSWDANYGPDEQDDKDSTMMVSTNHTHSSDSKSDYVRIETGLDRGAKMFVDVNVTDYMASIASNSNNTSETNNSHSFENQKQNRNGAESGNSNLQNLQGSDPRKGTHQGLHRHTNSAGSISIGSVRASSSSSSLSTTQMQGASSAQKDDSISGGNPVRPTALHSSFQRYTRSNSSSTIGSTGGSGIDNVTSNAIDDGQLPRSLGFSGGAFVPPSKQVNLNAESMRNARKPPVSIHAHQQLNNGTSSVYPHLSTSSTCYNGNQHMTSDTKNDLSVQNSQPNQHFPSFTSCNHSSGINPYPSHGHYIACIPPNNVYPSIPGDNQYYFQDPVVHHHPHPTRPSQYHPIYPMNSAYQYDIDVGSQVQLSYQPNLMHPTAYSPETVPPLIMSPLTLPSLYPMHHQLGMESQYHHSVSPISFAPAPFCSAPSSVPWTTEVESSPSPWPIIAVNDEEVDRHHLPHYMETAFHYPSYSTHKTSTATVTSAPTVITHYPPSWVAIDYNEYHPADDIGYIHPSSYQNFYHLQSSCTNATFPGGAVEQYGGSFGNLCQYSHYNGSSFNAHEVNSIPQRSFKTDKRTASPHEAKKKLNLVSQNSGNRCEVLSSKTEGYWDQRSVHTSNNGAYAQSSTAIPASSFLLPNPRYGFLKAQEKSFNASPPVDEPDDDVADNSNRVTLKNFYHHFRLKEKESLEAAVCFIEDTLRNDSSASPLYSRIYLELADLYKRMGYIEKARLQHRNICNRFPQSPEVWLEYIKFEEERGNLVKCSRILYEGLHRCDFNEVLLIRALKHEEKMAIDAGTKDLSHARHLLSRLKNIDLDHSWRALYEGALLESRAGNVDVARRVLKFLMHNIPWYGPLYLEYQSLDRDVGIVSDALNIIERGLSENPRYGPLWFEAFRLCEMVDLSSNHLHLPLTMSMIDRASTCLSKELKWKVYLEAGLAHERVSRICDKREMKHHIRACRESYLKAVLSCPQNMRWKVWLASGKMELSLDHIESARNIFFTSLSVVPAKGRSAILIELARLEDFVGNVNLARAILCKARNDHNSDWKVWFESISLETRNDERLRAVKLCIDALSLHAGNGRLWAVLVQLRQLDGPSVQLSALNSAVIAVPKSGEVWCEAARLTMNPFACTFNPKVARQFIEFAIKFTPQNGDSFLEALRLDMLEKYFEPIAEAFVNDMEPCLLPLKADKKLYFAKVSLCIRNAVRWMKSTTKVGELPTDCAYRNMLVRLGSYDNHNNMSPIELRCRNAEPNYGRMWFYCRQSQRDTTLMIFRRAEFLIREELVQYGPIYVAAWMRRAAIEFRMQYEDDESEERLATKLDSYLRSSPSLAELIEHEKDFFLFGNALSEVDFTTGLVQLQSLSTKTDQRKCLFEADALCTQ